MHGYCIVGVTCATARVDSYVESENLTIVVEANLTTYTVDWRKIAWDRCVMVGFFSRLVSLRTRDPFSGIVHSAEASKAKPNLNI